MLPNESGVPFLLRGETANPLSRVMPAGHYDGERQIWISPDGEALGYEMSRAGQESTWNATSTENGDSKGDHDDSD